MNEHVRTPNAPETRAEAQALDAADPLRDLRDAFDMSDGVYLDGNSLGRLPLLVRERMRACVEEEWGRELIASWNTRGWVDLPRTVGAKIAPLIGADPGAVRAADSTSVNLHKVLAAALRLRPDRTEIVSQRGNFPTDLYMAEGLVGLMGRRHRLRLVDTGEEAAAALGSDTAVLMLTHVDYRSGRILDMEALTRAAHEAGALAVWDLAHSAGAVPVDLAGAAADFAVGCGYKYLNGGPGAPAFLYVAPERQGEAVNPLSGWFAHAAPFAFETGFRPAEGADRFLCGTPPVLSMSALDAALDLWDGLSMAEVRAKSVSLTETFLALVERRCPELALASPRDPAERGSQVSLRHEHAYPIMRALIERGVVGDFRAPDIARFGFAPLYVSHADVWDAVEVMADIMASRAWDEPRHHARSAVT
jgi:kynureninase